ncbi:unnamed protein product [Phytomonas sp. EM1]|nr:unnamed protein product [Phytomonas sp. EM1]|eukprot:CCW65225.1 unnamed protein product [Phytomonas sp. isolate EM1]
MIIRCTRGRKNAFPHLSFLACHASCHDCIKEALEKFLIWFLRLNKIHDIRYDGLTLEALPPCEETHQERLLQKIEQTQSGSGQVGHEMLHIPEEKIVNELFSRFTPQMRPHDRVEKFRVLKVYE